MKNLNLIARTSEGDIYVDPHNGNLYLEKKFCIKHLTRTEIVVCLYKINLETISTETREGLSDYD